MISLCLPSAASLKPNHHSRHKSFSSPPRHNLSFESLKDCLVRNADVGNVDEAISTLDFMSRTNLTPDLTTCSVLLKSCIRTRNFQMGRLLHSRLLQSSLELDTIVLNSLISLYAKCGDLRKAEEIFSSMDDLRDLVSWSAMISCYVHNGFNREALLVFLQMLEFGEWPNEFCFSNAIRACWNREYAGIGVVIFGFLMKTGYFESHVCVGCALIDLFSKGFGDLESAKKVFDEMPEKNSASWTLMITRFTQLGSPSDAIELFVDMIIAGFAPDRFTFSSSLSACSELGLPNIGRQLHGLCSDVCVGCSLVDMYAKSAIDGSMFNSRKAFDRMPEHNVMSWTAIITGYVQNAGQDIEAIELYSRMIIEGRFKPDHFTFAAFLKGIGKSFQSKIRRTDIWPCGEIESCNGQLCW